MEGASSFIPAGAVPGREADRVVTYVASDAGPGLTALVSAFDVARLVRELLEPAGARPGARARRGPVRAALCTGLAGATGRAWQGAADARARALHAQVEAGEVLATASTAISVGHLLGPDLEWVDRGTRRLAGQPPERIYELAPCRHDDDGAVTANLDWARRAAPGPMVGRDAQHSTVQEVWRSALRGRRRTVLVTGEAGIGKTTFAAVAALEAHARGAQVLYGRWDQHEIAPYSAVREALGTHADRCTVERLRADVGDQARHVSRLVPDVGARLGATPGPVGPDPEWDRPRLFEAIGAWLTRIATRRPTVLVLDDLHWADQSSLLLLDHLQHLPGRLPLMVVVTGREAESGPSVRDLSRAVLDDTTTVRIGLGALDAPAVRRLVENALDDTAGTDVVSAVASALDEGTAGNPMLVQQVLRGLPDAHEQLAAAVTDRRVRARSVLDVVAWRLGQLPAGAVEAMAAASVIGKSFDLDLLAEVAGTAPVTVESVLGPALRAGLLAATGPHTLRFVHDVVQEALDVQIPAGRSAALHRRVGAALIARARAGEPVRAHEVAHHCLLGVDGRTLATAIGWARRAAATALEETAFESAVDLLERAIGAHDRLSADDAGDAVLACELRNELADAYDRAGRPGPRDARQFEAADIARRLGRTDLLVQAALGVGGRAPAVAPPDAETAALVDEAIAAVADRPDEPATALLLARRAQILHTPSTNGERRVDLDRALDIARAHEDPALLARVLVTRAITLDGPDDVADRVTSGREIHRLASASGDAELSLLATRVQIPALLELGRGVEARQLSASYSTLAHELRHPAYLAITECLTVLWAMIDGDWDAGERAARRLDRTLRSAGHPDRALLHWGQTFGLRWLRGGLSDITAELDEVYAAAPDSPVWWATVAVADVAAGRADQARRRLAEQDPATAVAAVDKDFLWWPNVAACMVAAAVVGDERWVPVLYETMLPYADHLGVSGYSMFIGAVDHHLGTLALTAGDVDLAAVHLERALDRHEALGSGPFVALSARALSAALSCRRAAGDAERAATLGERSARLAARHGLHGLADVTPEPVGS